MKILQSQAEDEEEKSSIGVDYKIKITKIEKELEKEKETALLEIKNKYYKRKQSIVGKMDLEGAKSRLKASLNNKNMSFLSTPSAQSFVLSPYDTSPKKATQVTGLMSKEYMMKPYQKLVPPHSQIKNMPRTPNRNVKIDFGL